MAGEHEEQVGLLQTRLSELLARVQAMPADDDGYGVATDDVIAAAQELIRYEERLPRLLDQAPRRLTWQLVRGSGVLTLLVAVLLGVCVLTGQVHWSWLLPAAVLVLVGVRQELLRVPPPAAAHAQLRPRAVLVAVGAVLLLPPALGLFGVWFLAGALVLSAVLVVVGLRR